MPFDGETYQPELDLERLSSQLHRVLSHMTAYGNEWWRTLREIADVTGGSEAGISARLRDLRKPKFGLWIVDRRRRGVGELGLWEYRVSHKDCVGHILGQESTKNPQTRCISDPGAKQIA